MNKIIQKLIEIDNLSSQIAALRLENPESTRIKPIQEKRDHLLREAFTSLGREYYRNATWVPTESATRSKFIIELSPVAIGEIEKDWLLDKIKNTSLGFSELRDLAEQEKDALPKIGGLNFLIYFLEEQFTLSFLREIGRDALKQLIAEKAIESDIENQKHHLAEMLDGTVLDTFQPKRMLNLIREAADAIASCNSNLETLAKLQGYIELSNPS